MNFVRLLPVTISLLLLSAHFSRAGIQILSLFFLIFPFFLLIKKQWTVKFIKVALIIGTLEWIRTLFYYIGRRIELGEPYIRLVIIIMCVALFTGLSILVFKNRSLKDYYNIQ